MKTVEQAAPPIALILALLLMMSAPPATAQTLVEAMEAYRRGDYVTALSGFGSYAKQGNAWAQFMIGRMYHDGEALPQDDAEAVWWYHLAAEQGNALAQFSLGSLYHAGRGVPRDLTETVRWYRLAAEQGEDLAQFQLGRMYDEGQGVPQDKAEAVRWYRLAAEQGEASAQFNLGNMYYYGRGVTQDDAEAVWWYRLAAEQGHARAQSNLGAMYGTGRGVFQDVVEAMRWYRLAADQGDATGQLNLGFMYANGEGVSRDAAEAVRLYRLAAKQEEAAAQFNLGLHYELGMGIVQNLVQAHKWYNLAAARFVASEQDLRDEAMRSRERVASRLTPAELTEAQVWAREWRPEELVAQRLAQSELDPSRRSLERESTGSGFHVSAKGHILTNAHVVRGCTEVRIPSVGSVHVTAHEDSSDLALIQAPAATSHIIARFRQGRGIRPGAGVVVVGYPLRGLVASGASVSTGAVSALAGPGDDRRFIQISAPVQPGNSGGPVLDTAGNVVGVVVAKLDALEVARSIGDIPQNVNFAVSAGSARAFLDDNGIL